MTSSQCDGRDPSTEQEQAQEVAEQSDNGRKEDDGNNKTAPNDAEPLLDDCISVIVLDLAQTRFRVQSRTSWTIGFFKAQGERVHKVSPDSQRLIYRGKLLDDDASTLRQAGVVENDAIIHLFPKPVFVFSSSASRDDNVANKEEGTAHVPRIVLDPNTLQAAQRDDGGQATEAKNNIRFFCFLLLVFSLLELLKNYTQEEATGDLYLDVAISVAGIYVAVLGFRAAASTDDNNSRGTLHLAKRYLYGTVILGLVWNMFYYFGRETFQSTNDNMICILQALLLATPLPAFLWVMCGLQARQYRDLLLEQAQEENSPETITTTYRDLEEPDASSTAPNREDYDDISNGDSSREARDDGNDNVDTNIARMLVWALLPGAGQN